MSRVTKLITFNLNERGRKYTGQDRSDVDVKAWVDLINSPATQEMVSTGGLLGYYGHQVRQLFGMNPPETAFLAGKEYRISPAVRTVEFFADSAGNVSHKEEFLETDAGEYAFKNYKAKVGGFSMAVDAQPVGGRYIPTVMGGMDYVLQQNFVENCGYGQFDSAMMQTPLMRESLECGLATILDCINDVQYARFTLDDANERLAQAMELEQRFLLEQAKIERRKALQTQRQGELYDGALCPTKSLEEFLDDANQFNKVSGLLANQSKTKKNTPVKILGGFFDYF